VCKVCRGVCVYVCVVYCNGLYGCVSGVVWCGWGCLVLCIGRVWGCLVLCRGVCMCGVWWGVVCVRVV
jgi:hypothetical protein